MDGVTPAVPDTLDELLSPAWLTAALASRFPGVEVTDVQRGPVVSRVTTNARFRIECTGGVPDGLAPELCAKGYFDERVRVFRHVGEPEACFYRDLAASTGVRTLSCVYADVDPTTRNSIFITEDVVVQGATFLDALSEYTPDQIADSIDELALLHAATWCDPHVADLTWLAPRLAATLAHRGIAEIRHNFGGPIGAGVPREVRDADRLLDAYRVLADLAPRAHPWCVIHGDPHVGNVYLDAESRPSFLDWQVVQRGPWYLDVGYHIASSLSIEDRRRCDRDLLAHYLDRLTAAGVDVPSWDDAWLGLRRGILYGYFMWGITMLVDPAITTVLLSRLGTAAADHDALSSVAR